MVTTIGWFLIISLWVGVLWFSGVFGVWHVWGFLVLFLCNSCPYFVLIIKVQCMPKFKLFQREWVGVFV